MNLKTNEEFFELIEKLVPGMKDLQTLGGGKVC